jgi:hypothetical protein
MATLQFPTRLPADLLVELGELTGIHWNSWELEPIICEAIRRYMHPQAAAVPSQTSTASDTGYQWKQVYLPDGTRLRASFGGKPYFATVSGTEIKSGDLTLTPSGFANLQGSGNRNAWKAVWLRFPGNEQWVLADVCRTKQNAAIARLFAGADYVAADTPEKTGKTRKADKAKKAAKLAKPPGVANAAKAAKTANAAKVASSPGQSQRVAGSAGRAAPAAQDGKPGQSKQRGRRGRRGARQTVKTDQTA